MQSKPSFEEAGLARHGVVETMLPLGAMPKKKTMQENGTTVKRIILRPSGVKTAISTTQEPTPGPRTPAQDAEEEPATTALSPPPRTSPPPTTSVRLATRASLGSRGKGKGQIDEDEDDEYDPKGSLRRRQPTRSSVNKKGRPSAADRRNSLISVKASPAKMSSAKTSPVKQGTSSAIPGASHDADFTKKVVEAAIDEALKHYRYPTAWALRKLYDEKADDAQFVAMIEDVFSQTADSRTMDEFFAQVEEKKREGKKGNRGCYHFFPPSTNSRYTPHKPKPSPYSHLLERPVIDVDDDGGGGGGGDNGEVDGENSRPVKRIKVIHHSSTTPRKKVATGAKGASGVSGILRTPTSRKRVRRDSASSESSLSSVMSLSSPEESHMGSRTNLASPSLRVSAKAASRAGTTVRIQSQPEGDAKPGPISTGTTRTKAHRQGAVASDGPSSGSASASSGNNSSNSTSSSSSTSRSASASKPPAHHRTHQQHHRQHQHSKTTATKSAAGDASMPGRLVASETPLATVTTTNKTAAKASSAAKAHMTEEQDGFWTRRRDAKRITNDYTVMESDVRNGDDERVATPARRSRRTRQSLAAPTSTRSTRSASKRVNDDDERTASPGVFSTQGDGSSAPGSRATTPTNLRPAKKHKSGLRIKLS
jgi:hypothetical protein